MGMRFHLYPHPPALVAPEQDNDKKISDEMKPI